MKRIGIALATVIALGGQVANAATTTCEMTKFSGAKKDVTISWIGTRFILDLKKNQIQMGNDEGWWKPIDIDKVQTTKNFTAYVAYRDTKDVKGNNHRQRYSFRAYNDGKGQVQMSQPGYRNLTGKGTCS